MSKQNRSEQQKAQQNTRERKEQQKQTTKELRNKDVTQL